MYPTLQTTPYASHSPSKALKYFDIGANISDSSFDGIYHNKQLHASDRADVIQRSKEFNVRKLLVVGGYYTDILKCQKIVENEPEFWTTVGVHPLRTQEIFEDFESLEKYVEKLDELIVTLGDKCAAIGECGLDFKLVDWSPVETQMK